MSLMKVLITLKDGFFFERTCDDYIHLDGFFFFNLKGNPAYIVADDVVASISFFEEKEGDK